MSFGTLYIARGIVFFFVCVVTVHAQVPVPEQFTLFDGERVFQADGSRGPFSISDRAIEAASERVWVDGVLLIRDRDYVVDARSRIADAFVGCCAGGGDCGAF